VHVETAYKAEITSIAEYLNTNYKVDQFVSIVKSYDSTQPTVNSITKTVAKIAEKLNQPNENSDAKQERIQHTKARLRKVLKNKWKNKVMHGEYIRSVDRELIIEKVTFIWISKGNLKADTESEIVAAQDQAIQNKILRNKGIKHRDR
jgi:hypothetical protein